MLTPTDLIDHSWALCRARWKEILPLVAIGAAAAAIFDILRDAFLLAHASALTVVLGWVGILAVFLINFTVTVALITAAGRALSGGAPSLRENLRNAGAVLHAALLTVILASAANLVGFLLLIVPGVIFSVWFAFAVPLTVLERIPAIAALRESRRLSANRFFPVLWRLLVPGVFWRLASILIAYLLAAAVTALAGGAPSATGDLATRLIFIVLTTLATPLVLAATVILLVDLKKN